MAAMLPPPRNTVQVKNTLIPTASLGLRFEIPPVDSAESAVKIAIGGKAKGFAK
jgi:hypothetical protein